MLGESVKRTDLEGLGELPSARRKDEEDGMRGRGSLARAKAGERVGSLGCRAAEEEDLAGKPRNWEVRSSYWVRSRWIWSSRSVVVLVERCQLRPRLSGRREV